MKLISDINIRELLTYINSKYVKKTSNNTLTGTNKFTNMVTLEKNSEVQRIEPSTPNQACFITFVKDKVLRSGYLGHASALDSHLTLANDINNADINFKTKGSGKVKMNNKDIVDIYTLNEQLSIKADKKGLHNHSNKNILDIINQDKIINWDKAVLYENSSISNANDWKTTGYKKTTNTTTNLPPQCSTDTDRWGVIFLLKENSTMGTQMFFQLMGNIEVEYLLERFIEMVGENGLYYQTLVEIIMI